MSSDRSRLFVLYLLGALLLGGVALAAPFGGAPHTFEVDTTISAAEMNANFDAVRDYLNGLEARLAALETEAGGGASVPAGSIVAYGGPVVPDGWLLCDGRELSRAAHPALFGAIGTVHGHGDSATTFNLPDLRGRAAIGRDDMGGTTAGRITVPGSGVPATELGAIGGRESHRLTTAQMPSHVHALRGRNAACSSHAVGLIAGQTAITTQNDRSCNVTAAMSSAGGGEPHSIVQPLLVVNYIIKL